MHETYRPCLAHLYTNMSETPEKQKHIILAPPYNNNFHIINFIIKNPKYCKIMFSLDFHFRNVSSYYLND